MELPDHDFRVSERLMPDETAMPSTPALINALTSFN